MALFAQFLQRRDGCVASFTAGWTIDLGADCITMTYATSCEARYANVSPLKKVVTSHTQVANINVPVTAAAAFPAKLCGMVCHLHNAHNVRSLHVIACIYKQMNGNHLLASSAF